MLKVAAFSGGRFVPSARFRVRQYVQDLRAQQIAVDEYMPAVGDAYPPHGVAARLPWLASQLGQRLAQVCSARGHQLTVLQRQMVSTINTFEWLTTRPRLLDVDDAIWLSARFGSVPRLARQCDGIVCGNSWLADYFSRYHSSIHVVPTAVDTRLWRPAPAVVAAAAPRRFIGWIGTRSNLPYLRELELALQKVLMRVADVDLLVVSDQPPAFRQLPSSRVIYRQWSEASEIAEIQAMSVGLMPLQDSEWARGKCSFKMLQYMACGVPAVVSPVGMNREVAAHGGALLARDEQGWTDALLSLLTDEAGRQALGVMAREVVERHYATPVVAAALAQVYRCYV